MEMALIRIACVAYVMLSPLFMIYLQQSVFRASFDDELGNRVITRLHIVSSMVCVAFFAMTLGICPGGRPLP